MGLCSWMSWIKRRAIACVSKPGLLSVVYMPSCLHEWAQNYFGVCDYDVRATRGRWFGGVLFFAGGSMNAPKLGRRCQISLSSHSVDVSVFLLMAGSAWSILCA